MKYEIGSEYTVRKEMEARLEKDSHRFTTTPPIPVEARLSVINAPDEPGRVRFSFNSQTYWTFSRIFDECSVSQKPKVEPGD
jgi:hypothetical protein